MMAAMRYSRILTLLFVLTLSACSTLPSQNDFTNLDKAKRLYEANNDKPIYAQYYARSLLHHNRAQDAFKVMTFATKSASYTPQQQIDAFLLMSDIHKALDHPDQQEAFIKNALTLRPKDAALNMRLTTFYHNQERYKEAQDIYDHLIFSCHDTDLDDQEFLAFVENSTLNLIAMDKFEDAFQLLSWAQDMQGNNRQLERTLRIVRGLMQSHGHNAPKPDRNPKA